MNRVQLSAASWKCARDAHSALAKALSFPDYYGHNLDALHDCLTDLDDTQLVIEDCALAAQAIENWSGFLAVFRDSAEENPHLEIRLLPGKGYGGFLKTLLEKFQVRRRKKQKDAFLGFARGVCENAGYDCREETLKGAFLTSRNLIAGSPEEAKVIFTAHYDTCSESPLPNLVFPQNRVLTILCQLPLIVVMVAAALGAGRFVYGLAGRVPGVLVAYAVYIALFLLLFFGPANRHTANDNTSGVAALLEIMTALPPDQKRNAAFIFFDNEEEGKVGSKAYAKKHPGITNGKILLNLDCVGDGNDLLIVAPRDADERMESLLRQAFQDGDGKRAVHCSARDTHYNSDQKSFPGGAAVAACRKNRFGWHVPRIHTRRDVICEESNLRYAAACAVRLTELASHH